MKKRFGFRLKRESGVAADDFSEDVKKIMMREDLSARDDRLVGYHGKRDSHRMEFRKPLCNTIVESRSVRKMFEVMLFHYGYRAVDIDGSPGERAFHKLPRAVADITCYCFDGEEFESEILSHEIDGDGEVLPRIDEGAVQVEYYAEIHDEQFLKFLK